MHESRADLEALQNLLDDSYARAGAHLRSIHRPERRLDAARLCGELQGVCILDLATLTRGEELTILVHGRAVEVDCASPDELPLRDCFREAYGYDTSGSWGKGAFWRLEPRLMFAAALSEPE
jgi:hypothetical protein